jgi:predicted transcriptional regulator
MNTNRYARVTFVLDRSTDDALDYIARRFRVSKSAMVRDVLREPVEALRGALERFPADGEVDPRQLALAGLELIEGAMGEAEGPMAKLREVAHG